MLILGLTGGIASGKSTVSSYLAKKGLPVVDADLIARQVVEPGKPAYAQIVEQFSFVPELVVDGALNRAALGQAVFGNDEHRARLNKIVHPAVRREMAWQIAAAWLKGYGIVVLDVPLLFEGGLNKLCGSSLLVACSDQVQLERLRARDKQLSLEDARQRIASQMPTSEKRKLADHIIENDQSLDELYAAVDLLLRKITPHPLTTLVEWFPPVGASVAAWHYLRSSL